MQFRIPKVVLIAIVLAVLGAVAGAVAIHQRADLLRHLPHHQALV
jgi:hypothetical protein